MMTLKGDRPSLGCRERRGVRKIVASLRDPKTRTFKCGPATEDTVLEVKNLQVSRYQNLVQRGHFPKDNDFCARGRCNAANGVLPSTEIRHTHPLKCVPSGE